MKYAAIYIDPPWKYKVWSEPGSGRGGLAVEHYDLMEIEEIIAIPIPDLMDKHCAVFMWSTWTHLPEAFQVGAAWGLTYKTCAFNWVKLNKMQRDTPFTGMGYWTRANSEPCLLFTKGSPHRKSKDVPQMLIDWQGGLFDDFETETIATPIGRHSEKPQAIYERIEALVPGAYCEVFARKVRPGWDVYGNEIDGRDIREAIAETSAD